MGRWAVVVMLHATVAYAQKTNVTIQFVCVSDRCEALQQIPPDGNIDIVIVGAAATPTVRAANTNVTVTACTDDSKSWCADGVEVTALVVTARAERAREQPPENVTSHVGDPRTETLPIRVKLEPNAITIDLVGPDVTALDERAPDTVETDERFEDVVLVGAMDRYRCTGVLVTPRHVLTAAHCLPATRVGFGNSMADAKAVAVRRVTRHPVADVAILELVLAAAISPRLRRRDPTSTAPLGVARILGFGVSDQLRLTGFGRKRMLTVPIDGWGCSGPRARSLGCVNGRELLMRGGRGNDTCLGDSGGPLFEDSPDGWRLVGITSRGTRPKKLLCGEGGIYSRVDVISSWIDEVTR